MKKTSTLILALALAIPAGTAMASGNPHRVDTTTDTVSTTTATLTQTEAEDLLYLREEEKLARDTYLTLYLKWHLNIFANIAASEEEHMAAVKRLLDTYGLEDPAQPQIGVFTNPDLQAAYDQLIARGSQSQIEALMVGGYIEELDIQDLEVKISEADNKDILTVYSELERGSRNHLRSFVGQIESLGIDYEAQILEQEIVDSIVYTNIETGS